jgi:hypothetical protein
MQNPKYLVTIAYEPSRPNGQQLMNAGGVTFSIPSHSPDYFVANMPELKISATGSSYTTALTNLLNIVTASTFFDSGNGPINSTRTY